MPAVYSSGLVFIPKAKLGDFDVVLSEKKLLMIVENVDFDVIVGIPL